MKFISRTVILFASIIVLIAPFTFLKAPTVNNDESLVKPNKQRKIEKPLHNVDLPVFAEISDVKEKKRKFFGFLKPYVKQANQIVLAKREKVIAINTQLLANNKLSKDELAYLNKLVKEYRIKDATTPSQKINRLLNRVDVIPVPLVLVQAANESAWGSSRFARIGLNFFGMWCFSEGCGMVPNARSAGKNHEVAAFESVEQAVSRYIYNLNTNHSYQLFRMIRRDLRNKNQPLQAKVLATGLLPYSERGADYISEILDMLKHNERYIY